MPPGVRRADPAATSSPDGGRFAPGEEDPPGEAGDPPTDVVEDGIGDGTILGPPAPGTPEPEAPPESDALPESAVAPEPDAQA
ncbi:MAG: hypothetical protein M3314_13285, partial [Actinomycetota bacterium]|nr:hypothetical protein [Actinomycetota bacterium]